MKVDLSILLLILGCAIVTIIPRIIPFVLVRNVNLPSVVQRWLSYIPICLLTALIVQGFVQHTESGIAIDWLSLLILLPTIGTALKTKSLLLTVVAGVASAALFRWIW